MNQPLADTLIGNADVVMMHGERAVYIDGFVAFSDRRTSAVGSMADPPPPASDTIDVRGMRSLPESRRRQPPRASEKERRPANDA